MAHKRKVFILMVFPTHTIRGNSLHTHKEVLFSLLNSITKQSSFPYATTINPTQLLSGQLHSPKMVQSFSLVCSTWWWGGQDSRRSCSRAMRYGGRGPCNI